MQHFKIRLRLMYAPLHVSCSQYTASSTTEHAENCLMHTGIVVMSIGIKLIPVGIESIQTRIALIPIDIKLFPIRITLMPIGNRAIPVGIRPFQTGIRSMSIGTGIISIDIRTIQTAMALSPQQNDKQLSFIRQTYLAVHLSAGWLSQLQHRQGHQTKDNRNNPETPLCCKLSGPFSQHNDLDEISLTDLSVFKYSPLNPCQGGSRQSSLGLKWEIRSAEPRRIRCCPRNGGRVMPCHHATGLWAGKAARRLLSKKRSRASPETGLGNFGLNMLRRAAGRVPG
jgi:hypothetical protein